jgi:energy-coupling factor transport system permease protein
MSPIAKLAWLAAVTFTAFATYHPVPLLVIMGAGFAAAVSARILRPVLVGLAWIGPLVTSVIVIQGLAPAICGAGCVRLASIGPMAIYAEGVGHGISLVARLLAMEVVAVTVLATTHPADLFAALRRMRLPHEIAFLFAMTLQLAPVVQREVVIVLAAQRARGGRGRGVMAVIPAFVPVFVGVFERMQQLVVSLESRGFGANASRTSYRRVRFSWADAVIALSGLAAGVAGTALGIGWWGPTSWALGSLPPALALGLFAAAVVATAVLIVSGVRAAGRASP